MTTNRTMTTARGPRGYRIALGAAIAAAALALVASPAAAAVPPVYNSIPTTLPGNVSSVSFEATQTREFGDYIALAGTERASANVPVTIVMSIWACETGGWTGTDCTTTPGATWAQPLTLTIYTVDHTSPTVPAAGSVVLTTTQTFDLPYRPSWDSNGPCQANGNYHPWHSTVDDGCWNGLAHAVTFTLPAGHTLPDELIWGISFNTQHYGPSPEPVSGPYNSLNVGVKTFPGQPSYGTDVEPDGVFQNSLYAGEYGDNGANGTGTFRDDQTGWTALKPLACFGAACPGAPVDTAPSVSPSAVESVGGAIGTPFESIEGAIGTPFRATPPPTSTGDTSGTGSTPTFALLICGAFGTLAVVAVGAQRGAARR